MSMNVFLMYPPCSPEELLETSDYAIEGYVLEVECGIPYNSGECKPWKIIGPPLRGSNYKPELVADCVATVEVTTCLKGNYAEGDLVQIPFLKLVQKCENGERLTFTRPKKDFRINALIRYYNSSSCAFSNFEELERPRLRLEIEWKHWALVGAGVVILASIGCWAKNLHKKGVRKN